MISINIRTWHIEPTYFQADDGNCEPEGGQLLFQLFGINFNLKIKVYMVILTWWIIFLLLLRRSFRWRTSSPCELILRWKEIIPRMEVSKRLFWSNFHQILILWWSKDDQYLFKNDNWYFQFNSIINKIKLFQNLIKKADDAPHPEVKCSHNCKLPNTSFPRYPKWSAKAGQIIKQSMLEGRGIRSLIITL